MNCTFEEIKLAIAECQAGNDSDKNFRTIFDCHYVKVLRFFKAQKNLRAGDWEDLTQEVFLRVYKSIKDFRDESAFTTWLRAIMRNHLVDYVRKHGLTTQTGHAMPESFNEDHEQLALDIVDLSVESNPHEMALDGEFKQIYREALNSLPGQMRSCMLLCLQGYTYQEIADLLRLNRGTVSKHLYDARAKLKAYLRRRYGGSLPDER